MAKQDIEIRNKRIRGAIAGSSPLWGSYQKFAFPNWATKFLLDSLLLLERTASPRSDVLAVS